MDYRGQVLNEYVYMLVFLIIGAAGFGAGLWSENFDITFSAWMASLVVAALACVPDWPVYNKYPIAWTGNPSVVTEAYSASDAGGVDANAGRRSPAQQLDQDKTQAQARARIAAQRRAKK